MPQPKKAGRPRMTTIVNHIKAGNYDDDMGMLMGAIADRNAVRQQAVLGLVRQVFGEDHTVISAGQKSAMEIPQPIARQPGEILPGESPHVLAPDALGADDELGEGYESRSPSIGSVE